MKRYFTYNVFGLSIRSEIEIPELIPQKKDDTIDIEVSFDRVPEYLNNPLQEGVCYQAGPNEFLLSVNGVARYYVKNGKEIKVEKDRLCIEKDVRLFLLGSAIGALIQQRNLLTLHGSAVNINNQATIFCGISGVGKSTLAMGFVQKGYKILTDDISVIDLKSRKFHIEPGYPSMKLWNDVLLKSSFDTSALTKVRDQIEKYRVDVQDNFYSMSLPVSSVYVLATKNTSEIEIEEVNGIDKFNVLKNQTYRFQFLKGMDKEKKHFKLIAELSKQVRVYRLRRPQAPLLINEMAEFVLDHKNKYE